MLLALHYATLISLGTVSSANMLLVVAESTLQMHRPKSYPSLFALFKSL